MGFLLLPFLLVAIPIGLSHRHSAEVRVPREVRGFSNFHPPGKRGPYETARVRRTCSPSPRPFRKNGTSFPQTVECGPADWHGHSRTRRYKCVSYPHRILIVTYEKRPPWILRPEHPAPHPQHRSPRSTRPPPLRPLLSYTPHSPPLPLHFLLSPSKQYHSSTPPTHRFHFHFPPRERTAPKPGTERGERPTLPPNPSSLPLRRGCC